MTKKFYELQFELETNCLLDCVHCSSAAMRMAGVRNYSNQNILDMLSVFQGPLHVYFTGGEPMLYEQLLMLCKQSVMLKSDLEIGLYTSGNMLGMLPITEYQAKELRQVGVVDCYLSVYSDVEEEHDRWTRRRGSFHNMVQSVENLLSAGIIAKSHLVLTRGNYNKLDDVINFCQQVGFTEVRILKLTPTGSAQTYWNEIGLSMEQQNRLIKELIQQQRKDSVKLTFSGYPQLHACRPFKDGKRCQAGTNLLYVNAEGDIYPCACTKRDPDQFKICHITNIEKLREYISHMNFFECNERCFNENNENISIV